MKFKNGYTQRERERDRERERKREREDEVERVYERNCKNPKLLLDKFW